MQEYLQLISYTLQKVTQLLFSITVGNTNLGSILLTASIFGALIGAILHASIHVGSIPARMRSTVSSNKAKAESENRARYAAAKDWVENG